MFDSYTREPFYWSYNNPLLLKNFAEALVHSRRISKRISGKLKFQERRVIDTLLDRSSFSLTTIDLFLWFCREIERIQLKLEFFHRQWPESYRIIEKHQRDAEKVRREWEKSYRTSLMSPRGIETAQQDIGEFEGEWQRFCRLRPNLLRYRLKFIRECLDQILQALQSFSESEQVQEWNNVLNFFLAIQFLWRFLQIFEKRWSKDWDPGIPGTTSVSWPWTIKASLAVLWGVCWMYFDSSRFWNEPRVSESEGRYGNTQYQEREVHDLPFFTDSLYNNDTSVTRSSPLIDLDNSSAFNLQPYFYSSNIYPDLGNLSSASDAFGINFEDGDPLKSFSQNCYEPVNGPSQDHDREIVHQLPTVIASDFPVSNTPHLSAQQTYSNTTGGVIPDPIEHLTSSSSSPLRTEATHLSHTFSPPSSLQYNGP